MYQKPTIKLFWQNHIDTYSWIINPHSLGKTFIRTNWKHFYFQPVLYNLLCIIFNKNSLLFSMFCVKYKKIMLFLFLCPCHLYNIFLLYSFHFFNNMNILYSIYTDNTLWFHPGVTSPQHKNPQKSQFLAFYCETFSIPQNSK